jgi:uncharacterized membrane protein
MVSHNNGNRRGIAYSLLIAVVAGLILGAGTLFTKMAMTQETLTLETLILFPGSWLAVICGVVGFLLMQRAIYNEYMTIILPVVTGLSTLVSVLLAFTVLTENIAITRWIGVVIIIIGTVVICMKRR